MPAPFSFWVMGTRDRGTAAPCVPMSRDSSSLSPLIPVSSLKGRAGTKQITRCQTLCPFLEHILVLLHTDILALGLFVPLPLPCCGFIFGQRGDFILGDHPHPRNHKAGSWPGPVCNVGGASEDAARAPGGSALCWGHHGLSPLSSVLLQPHGQKHL